MSSFNSFYIIKACNAAGETCLAINRSDGWSKLPMVLMDSDHRKQECMGRKQQVCEFEFTDETNHEFKVSVYDLGCDLANVTLPNDATLVPAAEALQAMWLSVTSNNVLRAFKIELTEQLAFKRPGAWLTGKARIPGIPTRRLFDSKCLCAGHADSWWFLPCGHEIHLVCLNRARNLQVKMGQLPRCPVCGKTD
jgi:hypothetical protein